MISLMTAMSLKYLYVVAAGDRPVEVFSRLRLKRSRLSHNTYLSLTGMSETWKVYRAVQLENGIELPGFVFSFEAKRLIHHYIVKTIIPLILIVMLSWVVFWVNPDQVSNQLSMAVTTVLTLVAYHVALSGRLPEIP